MRRPTDASELASSSRRLRLCREDALGDAILLPPVPILALLALGASSAEVSYFAVTPGAGPHDVAPAPDGTV
jgi:streptogramin lyase